MSGRAQVTVEGDAKEIKCMLRADPSTLAPIHRYFERKFPGWSIREDYEPERTLEVLTISGGPNNMIFTVKIQRDFLDYHRPEVIEQVLDQWQVGEFVRTSGLWPILITLNCLKSMRGDGEPPYAHSC